MGEGTVFDGLTDAAWAPLCRRVQAGERAAEVAAQAGVKLAALYRAQRRLGLRVADLPPEARAQRRRRAPRFEDRADDYRYRPADLCEGDWRRCAALYADGWSSEALGRLFGRCDSVIRRGMGLRRVARKPTSERTVKAPPRGLDVPPRPSADPEVRAACAVELDPDDLVASLAASDAAKARAAQVGLPQAVGLLCNMDVAMVRAAKARGRLALLRPGGFAGSPCPEGEGEAAWAEHGVVLHPHQRAPEGEWATWLMLGGRGAGKTFAGA